MTWQPPTPFAWNYCATCGGKLAPAHDGERELPWCAACNRFFYDNPVPACCVFVADGAGRLLFTRRAMEPCLGRWTLPGGFMESGETAMGCALRELAEETGLTARGARLIGSSFGGSTLYGCVLVLGLVIEGWEGVPKPGSDASELAFFARDERPDVPFHAHRELLAVYDGLNGA
ncbi:MAG: NUDIX hydrolase [Candidatus Hydrogenedens sp.]|nr:NUDIX hydrolase [Candidatus Hydrogenedentota bacterium]NLF58487.1 NUDIX hydrolase [Candidatus Hydrogenedens sp.]